MYPKAYIDFLIYFHCDRDYFECHEVLEEHWKSEPNTDRKLHWVGLIQIAVSLYHHRRGNVAGAFKMMKSAISILRNETKEVQKLGIEADDLLTTLTVRLNEIKQGIPYNSINLPISDNRLLATCTEICEKQGKTWGKESDLTNVELVNKHTLRDRSKVIAEREKQYFIKNKARK